MASSNTQIRTFRDGFQRAIGNSFGPIEEFHAELMDFNRGLDIAFRIGGRQFQVRRAIRSQLTLPNNLERYGEACAKRVMAGLGKTKERKRRARQRRHG